METAEYFQCWQTSLVQFKRVVGSSMDCLFSHHCLQGLIPQRWCQQAGLCPICYGKINMLLGWLKGHCLLWDESLLTSPSPVLCLPLGLPMQTSWKDLWWEPCILQQSVLLPIWLLAWPFFRKKENTDLFSGSSVQAPLGWPLGTSPEKLVSEGTAFFSRRRWSGFHLYTHPVLEGAQPALMQLRKFSMPLHCFCFCEVLCEIFFGSCSLSLCLLSWRSAVSSGPFASECPAGCSKSRAV